MKEITILGMLTDVITISTAFEYLKTRDNISEDADYTDEQEKEYDYLQNILSIEVSIYLTRRTSGCCGSIIDNLRTLRIYFILKYEKKFNKPFIDYNSEVDF